MKNYKNFIVEGKLRGRKYGVASSKKDAIEKGLRHFTGSDGEEREIRNYGSKSRPGGRVHRSKTMAAQRARREQRGKESTDTGVDLSRTGRKKHYINKSGSEGHHNVPLERTSHVSDMSPERKRQYHNTLNKVKVYVGNDRRNYLKVSPEQHRQIHRDYERLDNALRTGSSRIKLKSIKEFLEEAFKRTGKRTSLVRLHHGSDEESIKSIRRSGPRPSSQGSEGPGHYTTPDVKKARKYAEFTSKQRKKKPNVVSYLVPKKKIERTSNIPKGVTSQQKTTKEKPIVQNVRTGHVVGDPEYLKKRMIHKSQPVIRKKK